MGLRRLEGKVVMVTGATRGIGIAAAERLGAEGAHLVLAARGEDAGRAVEARLREAGAEAVFVAADMTDAQGPARSSRPRWPGSEGWTARSTTWAASWLPAGRLISTRPLGRPSWSST